MANSTDATEFELSKENILPIQQGRKANVLKSALTVKPEEKLLQQRGIYEQQLRLYSGDDPLSVWYSYIKWVEQNYPKGGRDGNLCKLIQQCLLNLKDEAKYYNDDRFIDTWIKFANLSNKPNEVYTNMYSRGIGWSSSKFYIAWAWEVEQSGDIKRADEILQEGLRKNAQPLDGLRATHAEVQMRLVKSFKSDSYNKEIPGTDHRSVFTTLKTQAKNKAPISRIGDNVIPMNNQQMTVNQQKTSLKSSKKKNPFKIYNENNEVSSFPVQNPKSSSFPVHSSATKENDKKLSKWTKVKLQQVPLETPRGPQFTVHCDNTPQPDSTKKLTRSTKVLTTHTDAWKPAIALFEEEDPMIRPMYDRAKVYGGGEEFSFEEIQAAKWCENQKQLEKERKRLQEEKEKEDLKKQVKELQEKMQYLETLAAPVLQSNVKTTIVAKDLHNETQPKLDSSDRNYAEFNKSSDISSDHILANIKAVPPINETLNECSNRIKEPKVTLQNLDIVNERNIDIVREKMSMLLTKENKMFDEMHIKDMPTLAEVKPSNHNSSDVKLFPTSIDINEECQISAGKTNKDFALDCLSNKSPDLPVTVTKRLGNTYIANEVDCMMQELYNGTIGHNAELEDLTFGINLEKDKYGFDFDNLGKEDTEFVDIKLKENINFLNLESQDKPEERKLNDFSIYCDPTEIVPPKPIASFPIFQDDEIKLNDENTPPEQMQCDFLRNTDDLKIKDSISNKESDQLPFIKDKKFEELENIPPPDYIQSTEKRELSGILLPSKNIHFVPLEKQQEEEKMEFNDDCLEGVHPFDDVNLTFAPAAFCVSTPCVKAQPISMRELQSADVKESFENRDCTASKETLEPCTEKPSTIYKILNEAVSLADCEKVRQLLMQILFDVTKRKSTTTLKDVCFNIIERLRLCCTITNNEKLKLLLQNCVKFIEGNIENVNLNNLMIHNNTLQLSTIMETSRESKSSSSSSSLISTKQRSIHNSHINNISKHKAPMAEIHENSEISETHNKTSEVAITRNTSCFNDIDPFDPGVTNGLLKLIKVPVHEQENFYDCKDTYFEIFSGSYFKLGKIECLVNNLHAEGAYAKVYSAQYIGNSFIDFNQTLFIPMSKLAIKVCKGVNDWEFYICSELQKRLTGGEIVPDISESVMEIKCAAAYENCLVMVSDLFEHGTLLDVVNVFKMQNTRVPEYLVMFFALEMLHIVSGLHKCGIVHGDIKPDNFMLNEVPNPTEISSLLSEPKCLRLIDFGRSIDLTLFKPGVTFSVVVKTDGFQCVQMRESRPWVFESDWYGVLACIHVLLFSEYMDVKKNAYNQWEPIQKFKRYFQTDIWEPLFHTLLNIPSCYEVPDLTPFIIALTERLQRQAKAFKMQLLQLKLSLGKKSSNMK